MALVKTAEYYFSRFELNFSDRGVVDGAGYTDVKAQLPALQLPDLHLDHRGRAVHLEHLAARLGAARSSRSGSGRSCRSSSARSTRPMIQNSEGEARTSSPTSGRTSARNIAATRDRRSTCRRSTSRTSTTARTCSPQSSTTNRTTIDNARLWDPDRHPCRRTRRPGAADLLPDQRRRRRPLHHRQPDDAGCCLVREVNSSELPSQSWINEHLVYTHGYGVVASPTNTAADRRLAVVRRQRHPAAG